MKPIALNLGGHVYRYKRPVKLVREGHECDGYCNYEKKLVEVRRDLTGAEEHETDVHETLHAAAPYLGEDYAVGPVAKQLAAAYRKLGYRKLTAEQLKTLGID